MQPPSEALKDRWLEALLPLAETCGWTRQALHRAAREAGLSPEERALAAPGGVNDLIDHFFMQAAARMQDKAEAADGSALKTHERVAEAIKLWLIELEPHRGAVRRAAGRGMLPWGAGAASQRVWAIADAIWLAAGDTATDYNRQTKRALLSAVLPSIILRWLTNPGEAALDRHIARRLQQAMRFGQAGSRFAKPILDRFAR